MPHLVFWKDNGRVGSLPITDQNRDGMKAMFCMSLVQTDASGTEHWNLLAPWGKSPQGKQLQAAYGEKYGQKALRELLAK